MAQRRAAGTGPYRSCQMVSTARSGSAEALRRQPMGRHADACFHDGEAVGRGRYDPMSRVPKVPDWAMPGATR